MCWRSFRSSADSGSSSRSTSGSAASALAMATRWRCPPDSSWHILSPWPGSAIRSSSSSARRRRSARPTPRTSRENAMFSHTDMSGKSARFWKMRAVGRLFGPIPAMSRPPMRTTPSEGSRKPDTARRMVVLPQPDGPRKLKKPPSGMSMFTSRAATKSPNLIHTPSSSTPALIACSPSWLPPCCIRGAGACEQPCSACGRHAPRVGASLSAGRSTAPRVHPNPSP